MALTITIPVRLGDDGLKPGRYTSEWQSFEPRLPRPFTVDLLLEEASLSRFCPPPVNGKWIFSKMGTGLYGVSGTAEVELTEGGCRVVAVIEDVPSPPASKLLWLTFTLSVRSDIAACLAEVSAGLEANCHAIACVTFGLLLLFLTVAATASLCCAHR